MTISRFIWITGAASGIGEALSLKWAEPGTQLILSDRDRQQLELAAENCRKKGAEVLPVPFDLTNRDEIASAAEKICSFVPRIDILANIGGISQRSLIVDTPMEVARRIMETDFWGHADLTQQILPFMVRNGGGTIVVLSSFSGLFGFPQYLLSDLLLL